MMTPPPMWKLHRYYLREISLGCVLTFSVMFGIVLISTVPRGIKLAQGFSLVDALKITFLWTVDAVPHLLPIALLFATVLTYARAGQEREITAVRSAGVSPRVAMTPALLVGIVLSLFGSVALHYWLPQAHFEKYAVVAQTVRTVLLRTGMLGDKLEAGELTMTWERRDEDGWWRDVAIVIEEDYEQVREGPLAGEGVFTADRARVELSRDGESLSLVLLDVRSWGATRGRLERTEITVDVRAFTEGMRRVERNEDLSTDHLLAEVRRGVQPNELEAAWIAQRRSCFALLPAAFAPIGFCIGVFARERGRMTALLMSLVPVAIAYVSDVVGERTLVQVGFPEIAWLPVALLAVFGVPFCWRLLRF